MRPTQLQVLFITRWDAERMDRVFNGRGEPMLLLATDGIRYGQVQQQNDKSGTAYALERAHEE